MEHGGDWGPSGRMRLVQDSPTVNGYSTCMRVISNNDTDEIILGIQSVRCWRAPAATGLFAGSRLDSRDRVGEEEFREVKRKILTVGVKVYEVSFQLNENRYFQGKRKRQTSISYQQ